VILMILNLGKGKVPGGLRGASLECVVAGIWRKKDPTKKTESMKRKEVGLKSEKRERF